MDTEIPDDFRALVRQQIADAFDLTPNDAREIFSTEPGSYGAAYLEHQAEMGRYKAELPARYERAAAATEAKMRADGTLPDGMRIVVERP